MGRRAIGLVAALAGVVMLAGCAPGRRIDDSVGRMVAGVGAVIGSGAALVFLSREGGGANMGWLGADAADAGRGYSKYGD